jgi:glucose uptake protein GlcU
LKEIISEQQAEMIIRGLCLLIVLGGVAWAAWRSRDRKQAEAALAWPYGIGIALIGPLLYILWFVYNAIENHYGLDSVKALLINLGLFTVVGIVVALLFARIPVWFAPGRSFRRK